MGQARIEKTVYGVGLFLAALSGFAQMPIFKRYYIADIPGFGWLAKFYVTHSLHYILAILLIAYVCYYAFVFLMDPAARQAAGKAGVLRMILLSGLVISGGILVYKNMSGVYMSAASVIVWDLIHFGLCMLLLFSGLIRLFGKKDQKIRN